MTETTPNDTNRLNTLLAACVLVLSIMAVGLAPPVMAQSAGGNDTLIVAGTEGTGSDTAYVELDQTGSIIANSNGVGGGGQGSNAAGALPSHNADHIFLGGREIGGPSVGRWNRTTESLDWESGPFSGEFTRILIVDDDGFVHAGFDNGSVVKLDPDDGSVISTNDYATGSSTPVDVTIRDNGNLLIVYNNDEVVEVNPDTEAVVNTYTPQEDIAAIAIDEEGYFYAGGGGNVTRFDDNNFIHGTISVTAGPSSRAMVVTEGNVFVGMGSSGVARYDFGTGNEVWNDSKQSVELGLTKDSEVITIGGPGSTVRSFNGTDGSFNWDNQLNENTPRFLITNATEFSNVPLASDPDTELVLNTGEFMQHGSDQDYSVTFTTDADGASDVSDEASVTSDNTSIVTVDETAHTLSATGDTSVNDQATITATFTDPETGIEYEDTVDVTVAQATMKNFKILPSSWRINALFSFDMGSGDSEQDTLPLIILISIFAGGITARVVSSFAGIGAMLLIIIVGWFGGWVGEGVVLSALFVGLFIGFNLAANIDYSVRRG